MKKIVAVLLCQCCMLTVEQKAFGREVAIHENMTTYSLNQVDDMVVLKNVNGISYNPYWGWTISKYNYCNQDKNCINEKLVGEGECLLVTKEKIDMADSGLLDVKLVYAASDSIVGTENQLQYAGTVPLMAIQVSYTNQIGKEVVHEETLFNGELFWRKTSPWVYNGNKLLEKVSSTNGESQRFILKDQKIDGGFSGLQVKFCKDRTLNFNLRNVIISTVLSIE